MRCESVCKLNLNSTKRSTFPHWFKNKQVSMFLVARLFPGMRAVYTTGHPVKDRLLWVSDKQDILLLVLLIRSLTLKGVTFQTSSDFPREINARFLSNRKVLVDCTLLDLEPLLCLGTIAKARIWYSIVHWGLCRPRLASDLLQASDYSTTQHMDQMTSLFHITVLQVLYPQRLLLKLTARTR